MALIAYNAETMVEIPKGISTVSFTNRGSIYISKALAKRFNLSEDDKASKVSIFRDEEDEKRWFVGVDPKGFVIRIRSNSWSFQNKALADLVRKSIGKTDDDSALTGIVLEDFEEQVDFGGYVVDCFVLNFRP